MGGPISRPLTSLIISMCCCCNVCTVGCAVLVTDTGGLKLCVDCCGLGTDTGVLLTGGCCFFLNESWNEWRGKQLVAIVKYAETGCGRGWTLPYSILNISHLGLDFHRNRIQNGTLAALGLIRAPFSIFLCLDFVSGGKCFMINVELSLNQNKKIKILWLELLLLSGCSRIVNCLFCFLLLLLLEYMRLRPHTHSLTRMYRVILFAQNLVNKLNRRNSFRWGELSKFTEPNFS